MISFRSLISKILRDERGNTSIIFAFALLPATVLAGGAVDVGNVYNQRARLQAAVDAAVLAANSMADATEAERSSVALKMFQGNTSSHPSLTNVAPTISVTGETIAIDAATSVPTPFLSLVQLPNLSINAHSTAGIRVTETGTTPGKVCLLALDPSSSDGIHIQGDNDVKYIDCWGHTNSRLGTAINADGSQATAIGQGHCAVGGAVVPHDNFAPIVKTGCVEVPDPFASVSAYHPTAAYIPNFAFPTVGSACKSTNLNLKKGTYTLDPGRYCGGIALQAHAKVTLNPGIYIIDNGQFLVQSGASVIGSNVLFYLTGTNANLKIIGGGTVSLAGRTGSNSYAGFLAIAHPNANRDGVSNIQGGGTMTLEGVIYAPRQTIEVSGNGHVNASTNYFAMVAKNFYFRGNGEFFFKKHTGGTPVPDVMPMMPVEKRRESVVAH